MSVTNMAQSSRITHKAARLNKAFWFCLPFVSHCCCAEQVQHQRQQHVSSAAALAKGGPVSSTEMLDAQVR